MDPLSIRLQELARPRHADPLRLTRYGHKVYSQNDEDGMIAEIFNRIGTKNRNFIEFGVQSGIECNTLWLLMQGWSGLWIEGNKDCVDSIATTHDHWLRQGELQLENQFITAENVNSIIGAAMKEKDVDLLSIDIDSNDFWVWKALEVIKPRVVVIEYNATWAPPASIVVPYSPLAVWNGSNYFGASVAALAKLGTEKGYGLVGCCLSGVNAFFVRNDLLDFKFLNPGSAAEHYEPARYFLANVSSGHRPAVGPVVVI